MTQSSDDKMPSNECLAYQLDILKEEIRSINDIVARMDTITQATKNWAIVTWTASIAFIISNSELKAFVAGTAILPLVFWIVDATWRYLQRRSIFRSQQISKFLNDGRLALSYNKKQLVGFQVYDPTGVSHRGEEEYCRFVSLRQALFYREVYAIYLTQAIISVIFGIVIWILR